MDRAVVLLKNLLLALNDSFIDADVSLQQRNLHLALVRSQILQAWILLLNKHSKESLDLIGSISDNRFADSKQFFTIYVVH